MNAPTKKQKIMLEFIAEFTKVYGYSPSYREIMQAMGLRSVSAVSEHIDNCIAAGFLKKTSKSARSLEVISLKNSHQDELAQAFRAKIQELSLIKNPHSQKELETLQLAAQILQLEL